MLHIVKQLTAYRNRNAIITLVILLLLNPSAFVTAQEAKPAKEHTPKAVTVPFVCNVGDSFNYEVRQNKYDQGKLASSLTRILKLEVVSSSDTEVVLAMNLKTQLGDEALKQLESNPLAKATLEAWDSLTIEVGISPNGVVQDVKNMADVERAADKTNQAIRKIFESMKTELNHDSKIGPDDLDRIYTSQMKRSGSSQAMLQTVLTPLNLILQLVDTELDSERTIFDETTVDLEIGKDLPATDSYRVVELDLKNNHTVFEYRRLIAGEEAAKKFRQGLKVLMDEIQPGHNQPEPELKISILNESTTTSSLDLSVGWPKSVVWQNKVNNLVDDQLLLKAKFEIRQIEMQK